MNKERVEFEQSAEGLFKGALKAHEDPALVVKLREAGLDLSKKLKPAFPAEDFYRWVKLVAAHQFPQLDEVEACREIGKAAVIRGLRSTLLGSAVLKALQLLGVRRALLKIGWTFKNGNNYIEAKVTELSPTSLDIQLGPLVGPPSYFEGILEEGPRQLGAKTVSVTQSKVEGETITFRVDWTE